jgi:hypothetical protein
MGWWMITLSLAVNAIELMSWGKWLWSKFKGTQVAKTAGTQEYTSLVQDNENEIEDEIEKVNHDVPDPRFTLGDEDDVITESQFPQDGFSSSFAKRKGHKYTPTLTVFTGIHHFSPNDSALEGEPVQQLEHVRVGSLARTDSNASDDTLHDHNHRTTSSPPPSGFESSESASPSAWDRSFLKSLHFPSLASPIESTRTLKIGKNNTNYFINFMKYFKIFCERTLLIGAFAATLSGITTYSGWCRAEYINGCLGKPPSSP